MAPPPANVGPGTTPGANPGNQAAATMDIQNGLKLLQRALPNVPMGTPLHTDILTAVGKIAKHMGEAGPEQGGLNAGSMMQAVRQQAQQAPQIAAMRAMGGGPSAPASPPAMPPPDAAAAP
jgi:hypothetical protein